MTNADLDNISISNDPSTNLGRVVDLDTFFFRRKKEFLQIDSLVTILDKDGLRMGENSIAPPYLISTYASNAWLVNPANGEVVGTDESLTDEEKIGLMGEYDFFTSIPESSILFYQMLYSKVVAADDLGRYNRP